MRRALSAITGAPRRVVRGIKLGSTKEGLKEIDINDLDDSYRNDTSMNKKKNYEKKR